MRTLSQSWQEWVIVGLAATWLAAQNVGIGTTTPLTRLHVAEGDIFLGDATGANGFVLHSRSSAGYDYFQISTRTGGTYEWSKGITLVRSSGYVGIGTTTPGAKLHVYDDSNGEIRLEGVNKARFLAYSGGDLWIQSGSSWTFGSTADIRFSGMFGSPIHMTIQGSTGNVGIGTTAPGADVAMTGGLTINGSNWTQLTIQKNWVSGLAINVGVTVPGDVNFYDKVGGSWNHSITLRSGNVGIGTTTPGYRLHVVGYVGAYGYYYTSDQRWKTKIKPIQNALDNVLKMQGVTYYWKVDEYPDQHFPEGEQVGFIAQEIEKVYPQVVHTDKDGYKSVDYSKLTPVLVEAIKEQQKIIEELQKAIQQLQEENSQVKQANAQLSAEIKMLNEKVDNLINSLSNDKKLGYR